MCELGLDPVVFVSVHDPKDNKYICKNSLVSGMVQTGNHTFEQCKQQMKKNNHQYFSVFCFQS